MFENQSTGMVRRRASAWLRLAVALWAAVFAVGAFAADDDADKKKEDEVIDLPEVLVSVVATDGSAEAGYRVKEIKQAGFYGGMAQQDMPYSMTVMSEDLINNSSGMTNIDQIIRMIPGALEAGQRSSSGAFSLSMRGFGVATMIDGIRAGDGGDRAMMLEDIERIEVMPGFTGSFYGAGYAGGTANFTLKRPTKEYSQRVTFGNSGGALMYIHGDFGGPIPGTNGRLGYRVNTVVENGETSREFLGARQTGITAVFDWHVTDRVLVQFDVSRKNWQQKGRLGDFWVSNPTLLPDPPDPGQAYGQKWSRAKQPVFRYGANLTWNINDHIDLRGAWRRNSVTVHNMYGSGAFLPPTPGYEGTVYALRQDPAQYNMRGGNIYADFKFETFGLKHQFTTGMNFEASEPWSKDAYMEIGVAGTSTYENYYLPEPDWDSPEWLDSIFMGPISGDWHKTSHTTHTSAVIGDKIDIGKHFTALAGFNLTRRRIQNNPSGMWVNAGDYDEMKWSPDLSLLYKPIDWLTGYVTWTQALEGGQEVPAYSDQNEIRWVYRNAGEILKPTTSQQYEIGVKTTLRKSLLLTAAYFYINKANFYTERFETDYTLKLTQDGRDVHKGFELGVSGKVTDDLTLWGGLTFLDAKIIKTNNDVQRDQRKGNAPEVLAKLYGEYRLPIRVRNLYVTGGVYFTDERRYATEKTDTRMLPSYTVFDTGARYEKKFADFDAIFQFNLQNAGDKWYWNRPPYAGLGDPRTITFSMTVQF
jgi:iron complex outermembrane receptor protein